MPRYKCMLPGLMLLFGLLVLGCANALRIQEVLEGDDAWVRELTREMQINAQYRPVVAAEEPWEFVLTIDNRGQYEPHLNTLSVEKQSAQQGPWECRLEEPAVQQVQQGPDWYLFFLEPRPVPRNQTVRLRMRCWFSRPGVYALLIGAEFGESGIDFFSRQISVEVHEKRPTGPAFPRPSLAQR